MYVVKRGSRGVEEIKFDKVSDRIKKLTYGLKSVDPILISQLTIKGIYTGIKTEELDLISANISEEYKLVHPDYSILAKRLLISNLHKTTPNSFSKSIQIINDNNKNYLSPRHYEFIIKNAAELDNTIEHENDYSITFLGYKILEKSYLQKIKNGLIVDRPQYIFMRVAVAVHIDDNDLFKVKETYRLLSNNYYIHGTPALFNSCLINQQMNSCFILGTGDSVEDIMKNATDVSIISKMAGGVGIHMHNIRCKGSKINSTNGISTGLPKQLMIYNSVVNTWDQGGKRLGACAIYLEPWHGDIVRFLQMKLNQGAIDERARDLFYGLWVPDLFMKRVDENKQWTLFNSNEAPGLSDVYDGMLVCSKCKYCNNVDYQNVITKGDPLCEHEFESKNVFTELYEYYEKNNTGVAGKISPRVLLDHICESIRESGTPYVMFKDHVNRQSNQENIGTIKCSNLCTEIVEWSSKDSYACCNLASLNLCKFVTKEKTYDYNELYRVTRMVIRNLDRIIDVNIYPIDKSKNNATSFRPIGLGVQALADVFFMLKIPYISDEAEKIDLKITETIYFAALTESCELAQKYGKYSAFDGSPASRGELQFDLWIKNQKLINSELASKNIFSGAYDWDSLKNKISKHGLRNSLLIAYMPTVSTSQILGNNESFEPISNNIYTKKTLSCTSLISNTHMVNHLLEMGLWNETLKTKIINNNGSILGINEIPKDVQELYKTVWEMKQIDLMKRSALRNAFIDQSQSMNIHLQNNSTAVLRGVITAGWKYGMKTGSYYIRSRPAVSAMKNNIAVTRKLTVDEQKNSSEQLLCYNKEDCESCSS